ncbi:MAG: TIGR01459 family HAD-type hydrolase, partial [Pseudomonadota bacterium]
MTLALLDGLSSIADDYDAILCDVWGVVHNGAEAHPDALDALQRFRAQDKPVVLLTNAPRPHGPIIKQLDQLGASSAAYDAVVSSGDAVRAHLIEEGYSRVYHLGPDRDLGLYEGTQIERVRPEKAEAIVVTDLRSD